jgi:hypothetical protein
MTGSRSGKPHDIKVLQGHSRTLKLPINLMRNWNFGTSVLILRSLGRDKITAAVRGTDRSLR